MENHNELKIEKIETGKHYIPLKKNMKNGVIPPHPFSLLISGSSGSGKTTLLLNLVLKPIFYGGYFHYILVFSPTASIDDLWKKLNIPKENIRTKFTAGDIEKIIESRKKQIEEKGIEWVAKHSRLLVILDDVIADRAFISSPEALKMFIMLRHYLTSVCVLSQTYNKIPKPIRNNCRAMMIFLSNRSEKEVLIDELTPPAMTHKEFEKVIDYCTDSPHDFIYINAKANKNEMIRKNLDEQIDLTKFKIDDTKANARIPRSSWHDKPQIKYDNNAFLENMKKAEEKAILLAQDKKNEEDDKKKNIEINNMAVANNAPNNFTNSTHTI